VVRRSPLRCIGSPTVNQPQRAVTKVPGGVAAAAAEWKIAFCLFMPVAPDSRVGRERLNAEEGDKSLPPLLPPGESVPFQADDRSLVHRPQLQRHPRSRDFPRKLPVAFPCTSSLSPSSSSSPSSPLPSGRTALSTSRAESRAERALCYPQSFAAPK